LPASLLQAILQADSLEADYAALRRADAEYAEDEAEDERKIDQVHRQHERVVAGTGHVERESNLRGMS